MDKGRFHLEGRYRPRCLGQLLLLSRQDASPTVQLPEAQVEGDLIGIDFKRATLESPELTRPASHQGEPVLLQVRLAKMSGKRLLPTSTFRKGSGKQAPESIPACNRLRVLCLLPESLILYMVSRIGCFRMNHLAPNGARALLIRLMVAKRHISRVRACTEQRHLQPLRTQSGVLGSTSIPMRELRPLLTLSATARARQRSDNLIWLARTYPRPHQVLRPKMRSLRLRRRKPDRHKLRKADEVACRQVHIGRQVSIFTQELKMLATSQWRRKQGLELDITQDIEDIQQ